MPETPIFLLAMDHRSSPATSVYGLDGEAEGGSADFERISAGKGLVSAGLERALVGGAPRADAGVLVDERYGADVARRARRACVSPAMPFERSGEEWCTFGYGTLKVQDAGDEPDIWKIEGLDDPADAERLVAVARRDCRDAVLHRARPDAR